MRKVGWGTLVLVIVGSCVVPLPSPASATPALAGPAALADNVVTYQGDGLQGVSPARLLDTRASAVTADGLFAGGGTVGPGGVVGLVVTGRGGVPASGVGAVVLNVTATGPSTSSWVSVYPGGEAVPGASNLNMVRGQTVPNLVVVKVGAGGVVNLRNQAGSTHLIADVMGYFTEGTGSPTTIGLLPGTELAGPGDVISAAWTTPSSGTVVLSRSADVPPAGGHVAIPPVPAVPDGFLGQVLSAAPGPNGRTVLAVSPADLDDAFSELEFGGGSPPLAPTGTSWRSGVSEAPLATRLVPAAEGDPDCGAGGTVSIDPSFQLDGLDVSDHEFSLSDLRARFRLTGTANLGFSGSVQAAISCSFDVFEVPIGAVGPIVFDLVGEAGLTASGGVSFQASVSAPFSLGFDYDDGVVENLTSLDISATGDAGDVDLAGAAEVTVSGGISAKVFGVLGFTATVGDVVGVSWQTDPYCLKGSAHFTAALAAEIGRWGIDFDVTLAEAQTDPWELFDVGDCEAPSGVSGTITSTWNDHRLGIEQTSAGSVVLTLGDCQVGLTASQFDCEATVSGAVTFSGVDSGGCGIVLLPGPISVELWVLEDELVVHSFSVSIYSDCEGPDYSRPLTMWSWWWLTYVVIPRVDDEPSIQGTTQVEGENGYSVWSLSVTADVQLLVD